ncbi:MAG: tyrosine-type recombinase/integrase [Acidimicrobiales bacterium]
MSLKRTPYGTWEVRWYARGKRRSKSFRTQKLADAFERKVRDDAERHLVGARLARRQLTVRQWCDEWLDGAHNLAPSTLRIYREAMGALLDGDHGIGDKMLDQLDKAAIDAALNAYRASTTRLGGRPAASSLHRSYRALRRALRVAVAAGLLDRSPFTAVDPPEIRPTEMRFLTQDELERLAATIHARWRTLVLVAGWGGLRWGELAGLRRADIDHRAGQVAIMGQLSTDAKHWKPWTKGRRRRRVDLPASVMRQLPGDGGPGYVWTMPRGGPLDHSRFRQRYWLPAVEAAGLSPLHPHELRHTSVALAVAAGAHPAEIQAQLGHDSLTTTFNEYGHIFPTATRQVADRLERMRTQTTGSPAQRRTPRRTGRRRRRVT